MTNVPIPDLALVRRIQAADAAYTVSRMKVLERLAGNPLGVRFQRHGRASAMMAARLPSPYFNRVVGLDDSQAQLVPSLVAWFRAARAPGRFDILPGDDTAEVCRRLAVEGYVQSGRPNSEFAAEGFHATLYASARTSVGHHSEVEVVHIQSAAAMEEFLDAYVAGWAVTPAFHDNFKTNVRPWLGEAGWQLYLARIGGKGAGAAVLFMHEGVGYFADSSTVPSFRKRGVHSALLARRWRDAAASGAEVVCAQAGFLSDSYRNMIRAGLSVLHTQAVWNEAKP